MEIHTGRAKGIDTLFDKYGYENGIKVIHHSFEGIQNPVKGEVRNYSVYDLLKNEVFLSKVLSYLGRTYPMSNFLKECFLLRNIEIEKHSDLLFGICYTTEGKNSLSLTDIQGGAVYACTAGFLNKKPVIIYSLNTMSFHLLEGNSFSPLNLKDFILTEERIGCVGTRTLTETNLSIAWEAIELFFSRKP